MNEDTYACINDVHYYDDEDPYTTPYGLVGLVCVTLACSINGFNLFKI